LIPLTTCSAPRDTLIGRANSTLLMLSQLTFCAVSGNLILLRFCYDLLTLPEAKGSFSSTRTREEEKMAEMGRMKKIGRAGSRRAWGVSVLVLAGLCGGLIVAPIGAHAFKQLTRVSARNTAIDGKAILLPSGVDPGDAGQIQIYSNSGATPAGDNVLYVTISGEGLGTCNGIALLCQVDGVNCLTGTGTPGPGSVSAIPSGWVIPLGDEFDGNASFGLTGVNFQWCAKLAKKPQNIHSIKIFGATAFGGCDTFLEGVHVYVDTNKIPSASNACSTYTTPNPALSPD
jgi:hypothetical protein